MERQIIFISSQFLTSFIQTKHVFRSKGLCKISYSKNQFSNWFISIINRSHFISSFTMDKISIFFPKIKISYSKNQFSNWFITIINPSHFIPFFTRDKISIFCSKTMRPFFNPMRLLKSFKNPYVCTCKTDLRR